MSENSKNLKESNIPSEKPNAWIRETINETAASVLKNKTKKTKTKVPGNYKESNSRNSENYKESNSENYKPLSEKQYQEFKQMPPVISTYVPYEENVNQFVVTEPLGSECHPQIFQEIHSNFQEINPGNPLISSPNQGYVIQPNILGNINSYQQAVLFNLKDHIDKTISKQVRDLHLNKTDSSDKEKKKHKRCYTCKPRGKVKKHIIGKSICNNFIFHHDMNHRPVILLTPNTHIISINDFSPELLKKMFGEISSFCHFWNIKDYQVSYSCGTWQANEHFHLKIKITDKIANRMRGDHFKRINLENRYDTKKIVNPDK
jgi:hypothetical protein